MKERDHCRDRCLGDDAQRADHCHLHGGTAKFGWLLRLGGGSFDACQ